MILFVLACAYAEGHMTPEEAVMLSYARGYGFRKATKKIKPALMAAVGLSYTQILPLLPEGIYVSCRNSSTSVTIAGLENEIKTFIQALTKQGVFAREVNSCNLALHTKYIDEAHAYCLDFLKTVCKDRQPRSSKWISSSVPEDGEQPGWAKYSNADYHFNNFRNPVLFEQALKHIPENAILIEVSPHGTLQPILKRELGSEVTNICLAHRNSDDNENFFLNSLGR